MTVEKPTSSSVMKKRLTATLVSLVLAGCGSAGDIGSNPETPTTPPPNIGEFSLAENNLYGCGMTLWNPDRTARDQYVFFNGIEDGSMRMLIDGELLEFSRVDGSGQDFYGQKTAQTFRSADGMITASVTVTLGQQGEIESVAIADGTIRVERDGATVEVPVVGDAGC
jgi:hypothetical protein